MNRKNRNIVSFCLLFFMLIIVGCTNENMGISNTYEHDLKLDQGETLVSISKNDSTGYNRWIPFYFTLNSSGTSDEVEQKLSEKIKSITLFNAEKNAIYETSKLIWSVHEISETKYNLSLVIIPKPDELIIDSETLISQISLNFQNQNQFFCFENYIINSIETVSESEYFVSNTTTETSISDDLLAEIHYSITRNKKNSEITKFDLEYPMGFAGIESVNIKCNGETNNEFEYVVSTKFKQKQNKVVYRPFIKIQVDNKNVYLIPSLPAYID